MPIISVSSSAVIWNRMDLMKMGSMDSSLKISRKRRDGVHSSLANSVARKVLLLHAAMTSARLPTTTLVL